MEIHISPERIPIDWLLGFSARITSAELATIKF